MIKRAELRIPKKLRRDGGVWLPQTVRQMEAVGQAAIDMIRNRIITTQTDGTGRKMPKLNDQHYAGWFWTSINDTRFKGLLKRATWTGTLTKEKLSRGHVILVHSAGYADLKQKMTGRRAVRKDGNLTGDMWRGFGQLLKKVKGGWQIKLQFTGGSRVGKVKGWGNKTIKAVEDGRVVKKTIKVPKMKTQTLRNRDKARGIQTRGEAPVVALLSLTRQEQTALMQMYTSMIRPFGDKVAGGSFKTKGHWPKVFRKK